MLSATASELLRDKTCQLLWDEGMKIENDEIVSAMLARGCPQGPSGRVRIPRELIAEMVEAQKPGQTQDQADQRLHYTAGIDWAHHIIWHGRQEPFRQEQRNRFVMSAFDCGPTTYYDYAQHKAMPVDTDVFVTAKKFAQATPEIGYISTWYRQNVSPRMERIESLVLGLQYTDKLDGIEAIYPEVLKYLKELSEIITGRPGDTSYVAGSECITSPLILERRSAEDIVQRKHAGIHRYHVASMPTIGISTPVTSAGAVVMTAAEVLGGMAACFVWDPDSDLSGRAIALVTDMRNGNNTPSGPEPTLVNLAVRQLFDTWWGGQCWVEVLLSPYAKRPGLQAVYENLANQWRYSKLLGEPNIPYPGMGTLDSGGLGSPAQFMLDMEIRKSQFALPAEVDVTGDNLAFEEICEATRNDEGFLAGEHTAMHCRELWNSNLFLNEPPTPDGWAGDEKAILDKCEQLWRANLEKWEPPTWPKEKLQAMQGVVARAKKEFSID